MKQRILYFIKPLIYLTFVLFCLSCKAQTNRFGGRMVYLSVDFGLATYGERDSYLLDHQQLDYVFNEAESFRFNSSVFPVGNLGYSFGFEAYSYPYSFSVPSTGTKPTSYFLSSGQCSFNKKIVYTGLCYRFQKKRFLFVPQLQFGYKLQPDTGGDRLIKEQDSNSIKRLTSTFTNDHFPFYIGMRADLRFHISKQFGVMASASWDRYRSKIDVESKISDEWSQTTTSEQFKLEHQSLFISAGLFLSFGSKYKDPEDHGEVQQ